MVCDNRGEQADLLYVRCSDRVQVRDGKIWVPDGEKISTDTYMNVFDLRAWRRYTVVSEIALAVWLQGRGILKVLMQGQNSAAVCVKEERLNGGRGQLFRFPIPVNPADGILYFEFCAEEDTLLKAEYETDVDVPCMRKIKISLIICTYKRKRQLEKILKALPTSAAEDRPEDGGWLRTVIIDNASELKNGYGETVSVYHNPNTGGAGGFARGMEETVRNLPQFPATHAVFMDDDVILQAESLYRLRALLTYLREEYDGEVVAGRMFRLDKPHIQYTAAEIWNGGDLRHIGWNQDMTKRSCLWDMNQNEGAEYGGWWFACYPAAFVKKNRPLPFFLHCDDVEYGLRHGGTPIIWNGIQVWHETYEYRQSPTIAYYDIRNSLFVNMLYGIPENKNRMLTDWKDKISEQHGKGEYLTERMMILGMADFLRGLKWLESINPEKNHQRILKKCHVLRLGNVVFWRVTWCRFLIKWGRKRKVDG